MSDSLEIISEFYMKKHRGKLFKISDPKEYEETYRKHAEYYNSNPKWEALANLTIINLGLKKRVEELSKKLKEKLSKAEKVVSEKELLNKEFGPNKKTIEQLEYDASIILMEYYDAYFTLERILPNLVSIQTILDHIYIQNIPAHIDFKNETSDELHEKYLVEKDRQPGHKHRKPEINKKYYELKKQYAGTSVSDTKIFNEIENWYGDLTENTIGERKSISSDILRVYTGKK